jgi:AraC family transcriptional regulator of adaptative response/methylated-DNA-[protein]-cysteine methyltransferase
MMRPVPDRFTDDVMRLAAVRTRDARADGRFFYAVVTTGVYCYPSCAARPPLPQNIAFHATREDAQRAGFRPCRRCRPDLPPRAEREVALIAASCRSIERSEQKLTLADLARRAKISPYHFHRMFRRITGVTPQAYAAAHRQARVQDQLAEGAGVTEAMYQAGFNSSGRFYEAADAMLGMTASRYRAGGKGESIRFAYGESSLGAVLVAATARGLCAILLGADRAQLLHELQQRFPEAGLAAAPPDFAAWVDQVVALVDEPGHAARFDLPLDIRGTAFQRLVWQKLRAIPAGETRTYGDIAVDIGKPTAFRAVARACGANPLAVAIPCHRVIAAQGGLAGYRWGIERKRALLARESGAHGAAPIRDASVGAKARLKPR